GFSSTIIKTIRQNPDWPSDPRNLISTLTNELLGLRGLTRPSLFQWTDGSGEQWSQHTYEKKRTVTFWNDLLDSSSRSHKRGMPSDPTVLILSVHEEKGRSVSLLRDLPQRILEILDSDADAISYAVFASECRDDGVAGTANRLRQDILDLSRRYMHIILLADAEVIPVIEDFLASDVESVGGADKAGEVLTRIPS